jgi:hypothetical protein
MKGVRQKHEVHRAINQRRDIVGIAFNKGAVRLPILGEPEARGFKELPIDIDGGDVTGDLRNLVREPAVAGT